MLVTGCMYILKENKNKNNVGNVDLTILSLSKYEKLKKYYDGLFFFEKMVVHSLEQ
jgi:hypothetical protein